MNVYKLERPWREGRKGAAAVVVAHSLAECLSVLGWRSAVVRDTLAYHGCRRSPWVVTYYDAETERVIPSGVRRG